MLPDEIVVSDDASTDETLEVVEEYARGSDVAFRVLVNEQRVGHVANFERALRSCRGDIIFLSDQDDRWYSDKVAKMVPAFDAEDILLAYCDARVTDLELRPTGRTMFESHGDPGIGRERRPRDLAIAGGVLGCTMAVRSQLVDLCLPIPAPWGHDTWTISVASAVGAVKPIPEILQDYRRHPNAVGRDVRIDKTPFRRMKLRLGRYSMEMYEEDLVKWSQLAERMKQVRLTGSFQDLAKFEAFEAEYERRRALAEVRVRLPGLPRSRRLRPVLSSCLAGDYARYLRPVGSPAKDLLRRRLPPD